MKQALETQPTHWSYFCQRKQEIESTRTIKNQFIRHGRSNVNIELETILTNKQPKIFTAGFWTFNQFYFHPYLKKSKKRKWEGRSSIPSQVPNSLSRTDFQTEISNLELYDEWLSRLNCQKNKNSRGTSPKKAMPTFTLLINMHYYNLYFISNVRTRWLQLAVSCSTSLPFLANSFYD